MTGCREYKLSLLGTVGIPSWNGVCKLPALTGSTKTANLTLHLLYTVLLEGHVFKKITAGSEFGSCYSGYRNVWCLLRMHSS